MRASARRRLSNGAKENGQRAFPKGALCPLRHLLRPDIVGAAAAQLAGVNVLPDM
jgi:hypothetical protein